MRLRGTSITPSPGSALGGKVSLVHFDHPLGLHQLQSQIDRLGLVLGEAIVVILLTEIDAQFLYDPDGQDQVHAEGSTRQPFIDGRELTRSTGRPRQVIARNIPLGCSPDDVMLRDVRGIGKPAVQMRE